MASCQLSRNAKCPCHNLGKSTLPAGTFTATFYVQQYQN
nr:CD15/CS22/SEF14 family fimbrial major subunit [Salmonella enterica]